MTYKSIHEAVKAGNTTAMEQMVKSGASVNEVDAKSKFTPLHWAACVGALEVRKKSFQLKFIVFSKK